MGILDAPASTLIAKASNPTRYNASSEHVRKWRAALGKYAAGTYSPTILMLGDSTTFGQGSNGAGQVNARVKSSSMYLATALTRAFGNADASHNFNKNNGLTGGVTYAQYDPRVTLGTNWSEDANATLLGGFFKSAADASAGAVSFATTKAFDRIDVYYLQQSNTPTAQVDVDGSIVDSWSISGAQMIVKRTISFAGVAAGAHTINIKSINTGSAGLYIASVRAYSSTIPEITIVNAGRPGSVAGNFSPAPSGFNPHAAFPTHAPDLTVLMLTTNDSNNGTAIATYKTNMQSIITTALESGSVLLATGYPYNTAPATNGALAAVVAKNYELARENNIPLLDLDKRYGSYAITNALTAYYDSLHPSAPIYADAANAIASLLSDIS